MLHASRISFPHNCERGHFIGLSERIVAEKLADKGFGNGTGGFAERKRTAIVRIENDDFVAADVFFYLSRGAARIVRRKLYGVGIFKDEERHRTIDGFGAFAADPIERAADAERARDR